MYGTSRGGSVKAGAPLRSRSEAADARDDDERDDDGDDAGASAARRRRRIGAEFMIGAHWVVPPAARSSAMRASHAPSSASSRAARTRATSRGGRRHAEHVEAPGEPADLDQLERPLGRGHRGRLDELQLGTTRLVRRVERAHLAEDAPGLQLLALHLGRAGGLRERARARLRCATGSSIARPSMPNIGLAGEASTPT